MATPRTWRLTPIGVATLVSRWDPEREHEVIGAKIDRTTVVLEAEPVLDLLKDQVDFLEAVIRWMGSDHDEIHKQIDELQRVFRKLQRVFREAGRLS